MRRCFVPPSLLLALLLSVALLAPAGLAQVPDLPDGCGPFEMTVAGPPGPIAPGETAQVAVTVANGGDLDAVVAVAASLAGSPGWRLTSAAQQDARIAGDESATFQFTLSPESRDAAPETSLNFAASADCSIGQLSCPEGSNACRASATATGVVRLAEPEGFVLPGLENVDLPVELLLGGLLLAGVAAIAPLAMRRKKGGFLATCPEPLKLLRPGHGVSFPIEVRNRGRDGITVAFEMGTVPAGWSAFMAMPETQLAPEEKRVVFLMVRAPPEAPAGATADVPLRVKAGDIKTVLRVRAEVDPNATISKGTGAGGGPGGPGGAA